jgi:hypothetical protein
MARLASGILVNALVRRVNQQGGSAMVLARGDDTAGGILFVTVERGANPRLLERGLGPDGEPALLPSGPSAPGGDAAVTDYWRRRRAHDADLWVVELDIAGAERFIAETMGFN